MAVKKVVKKKVATKKVATKKPTSKKKVAINKPTSNKNKLTFKEAFHYPFNRAKGLWNILWILLPIFGWAALIGYSIRLTTEWTQGKFKQLPLFEFKNDMKLGFKMFIRSLPFIIVYLIAAAILNSLGDAGNFVNFLIEFFIIPILFINFAVKRTVDSLFEFSIVSKVFNNLGDYIVAVLKTILLALVFILMSIILVGIPANMFSQNMFLADFYRRSMK
ncbi:MAG: DUF4013 domain-containing protein [Nanoarchaeota archaeon]|jgi:hypothetical protein|nr:DUF4013 domain-containing protein [Nanoarchaeota archaeon]